MYTHIRARILVHTYTQYCGKLKLESDLSSICVPHSVGGVLRNLTTWKNYFSKLKCMYVEPPNKGHFGANSFVEVVPISEVK